MKKLKNTCRHYGRGGAIRKVAWSSSSALIGSQISVLCKCGKLLYFKVEKIKA